MESGTKLGHYEIGTLLGKGGMGEVWRARDMKLGREVAIKTLPEEFAKDADRLAWFEREAKLRISDISSGRRLWQRCQCRRMGVMSTRARPQAEARMSYRSLTNKRQVSILQLAFI